MWFTKDSTGFRGWFAVAQGNGSLRTGLVAGDFTVTIVDDADTASVTPTVVESTQKSGLYYFDIASVFLTTNGIGEYGVVVQVDTFAGPSGGPNVRTAFSSVLKVSEKDLNDIADQSQIDSIEASVNAIETNVSTLVQATISEQLVVVEGSSGVTVNTITTNATLADDFYNGQLAVFFGTVGTTPVAVSRTIADYTQTNGTFFVSPDLPFVPQDNDPVIILARTATASVDNNAIATAVWTIATSPTTVGSYGELVNIIGDNAILIPAAL